MDTPFRIWRRSLGLTQENAADTLFVDVRTVQRYEAGERTIPGPTALLMTLAAMGVAIDVEPWPDNDPVRADEMLAEFRTGRPTTGQATSGLETTGPLTADPSTAGQATLGPATVGPATNSLASADLSTVGHKETKSGGLLRRLLGRSEPTQTARPSPR
jgi:transcriptional regulator with XRE-family HTH domain